MTRSFTLAIMMAIKVEQIVPEHTHENIFRCNFTLLPCFVNEGGAHRIYDFDK